MNVRSNVMRAPRTENRKRTINFEALYASASPTGCYRDSRGYEILREKAYEAQRRGYVLTDSEDAE